MSVTPTEAVGPPSLSGMVGTGATTQADGSADKQMFLELLVAQMRYQDPMNPTDSGEFLAQTAQFTALEKMQEVSDRMGMLLSTQMAFGATGMLGSTVEYLDETGATLSGVVRGVTYTAAGPQLNVDGVAVPLGNVVTVGEKAAGTEDTTTTTDGPATGS